MTETSKVKYESPLTEVVFLKTERAFLQASQTRASQQDYKSFIMDELED